MEKIEDRENSAKEMKLLGEATTAATTRLIAMHGGDRRRRELEKKIQVTRITETQNIYSLFPVLGAPIL